VRRGRTAHAAAVGVAVIGVWPRKPRSTGREESILPPISEDELLLTFGVSGMMSQAKLDNRAMGAAMLIERGRPIARGY